MAPFYPEEVDVFSVPHSRMKELVHKYLDMLTSTNFSDVYHLTTLLENLLNTFNEFKAHEHIENKYIMKKLKNKMRAHSVSHTAVCNCHKDNRLSEMLHLLEDGYKYTKKNDSVRINYGIQLRKALEEFTGKFLPHMKEEEEVFQPLLMQYFTYDELKALKTKVIQKHFTTEEVDSDTEEKQLEDKLSNESSDEEGDKEKRQNTSINSLPDELMLKIFRHLPPKDLLSCARVSHRLNDLTTDGSLWTELYPVQWARGFWTFKQCDDLEGDFSQSKTEYSMLDDDADIDESPEDSSDEQNAEFKQVLHEAKMLTSIAKHLLPKVGNFVKKCNLAYSKGLSNGMLYKILKQCPNLEELNLIHTKISDIAFKGFGKNGCGEKLRHVDLSGCDKITDVSLKRISKALGCLPCLHTDEQENVAVDGFQDTPVLSKIEQSNDETNDVKVTSCENCVCEDKKSVKGGDSERSRENSSLDLEVEQETKNIQVIENAAPDPVSECPIPCQTITVDIDSSDDTLLPVETLNIQDPNEMLLSEFLQGRIVYGDFILDSETWHTSDKNIGFTNDLLISDMENVVENFSLCKLSNTPSDENFVRTFQKNRTCIKCHKTFSQDSPEARRLEFFSLSGCHRITDDGIRALADFGGLPCLWYLDLSGCFNLTSEGLLDLVAACPKLDHRHFYYCDNIWNGPFSETAGGCQNLQCPSRFCCRFGD